MRLFGSLAVLLAAASLAPAQDLSPIRREIDNLARATAEEREDLLADLRDSVIRVRLLDLSAVPAIAGVEADGLKIAQQVLAFRRADVQAGASSGASGSTSAVLSPLLPAIFGVSFENGAITRSVAGSTVTFRANPAGLFCASGPDAAAVGLRDPDVCKTFWKRLAITAAFDTNRGEKKKELADLRTLNNQFSEFTARFELVNQRTLSRQKYADVFTNEIAEWRTAAQAFVNKTAEAAAGEFETRLRAEAEKALSGLFGQEAYTRANEAERIRLIEAKLRDVLKAVQGELVAASERRRLWLDALRANDRLQSSVANALVVTAEYGYQSPDLATEAIGSIVPAGVRPPGLHSLRLIAARGMGPRRLDITWNATASFFNEARPGMRGRFRDFRTGTEGKFRLREINDWGAPTLSFAALYVYLHQEPLGLGLLTFNQSKISERGHIGLFQTKLELPTANNAVRIPFSFTYSNRTELIKESDTRVQVGFSFNLDSLFDKK